ncbi:MAG TPA: hypothetical protein VLY21_00375 [Nitrososphaerales archaeon]|nr:hypothetical protein [Nitrososphaerales archaeon]
MKRFALLLALAISLTMMVPFAGATASPDNNSPLTIQAYMNGHHVVASNMSVCDARGSCNFAYGVKKWVFLEPRNSLLTWTACVPSACATGTITLTMAHTKYVVKANIP